jgi:hypothetical protein
VRSAQAVAKLEVTSYSNTRTFSTDLPQSGEDLGACSITSILMRIEIHLVTSDKIR